MRGWGMTQRIGAACALAIGWLIAMTGLIGCLPQEGPAESELDSAARIEIDGAGHLLSGSFASLGTLEPDRVLRLHIETSDERSVLILLRDGPGDSATVVGGGVVGQAFQYRVQLPGEYLVYVSQLAGDGFVFGGQRVILTVSDGDPEYRPPARQVVRVVFEPQFLTNPGLTDPASFTPAQVELIAGLEPLVRQGVLDELGRILASAPIDLLDEASALPAGPFSTLTVTPLRMPADRGVSFDTALPDVDPDSPCAAEPVVFGELLPRGVEVDPGNQNPSDEAVVYVGSFQGRGADCQTAVLASLNNIILAIAHTAAHEIGHLIGLQHVALVDVMDRRPTVAFTRDLGFARGQVLIDVETPTSDGGVQVDTRVLTSIYQDPNVYFSAAFGP